MGVDGARRRQTLERRNIATGGARFVVASTNGELPTGHWSYRSVPMPVKQKSSRRTAAPQGLCENLIRSRVLSQAFVRQFVEIDNNSAVDVGQLRKDSKAKFQGGVLRTDHQGRSRRIDIES